MKTKTRNVGLYVHMVEDFFLPSLAVGARRQRPDDPRRPPHLTPRQWALWYLVSGCVAGKDVVVCEKPALKAIELSMRQRDQEGLWSSLNVAELPGGCFRITGKTNKI